ncbi:MAG: dihydrofolate reductase family protein [Bacteroidota bacterium]|nr:dihydrofolate reductase family protein [Bacteroidota bacterium]
MRKVILFNMITLDGYFERQDHSIEWHNVDEEFNEFAIEQLNNADVLLFGRATYDLMASYWPSVTATTDDPMVAHKMNTISKIVFSKTMKKADWENTRVINENIQEEITKLKNESGKDMYVFGSAELASSLRELGLIDEYRIMINPLVIGHGKPLFTNVDHDLNLKLLKIKQFKSGNVLLYYEPKRD